ncbi:uncharacterized protein LOC134473603 isoform X2 [Cavia porcellus]|uniref:uncharacterized protein LOC134473603 isoform X2 n=1 Tax=Cavia porcellus TaxID=10141 RepID=UPI002FE1F305
MRGTQRPDPVNVTCPYCHYQGGLLGSASLSQSLSSACFCHQQHPTFLFSCFYCLSFSPTDNVSSVQGASRWKGSARGFPISRSRNERASMGEWRVTPACQPRDPRGTVEAEVSTAQDRLRTTRRTRPEAGWPGAATRRASLPGEGTTPKLADQQAVNVLPQPPEHQHKDYRGVVAAVCIPPRSPRNSETCLLPAVPGC